MALTKKNLEAILGEEPLSEFINVMDYATSKNGDGIYYCQNGYRGFAYYLEPNAFASIADHKSLISFFDIELPTNSAIQIISVPSRNLDDIFRYYGEHHTQYNNVKEPERIKLHAERRLNWLYASQKKGLVNKNFDFFPKNWVTITSVMIPEKNNKGRLISDDDIVSFKNKVFSKLIPFGPTEAKPKDIIKITSELIEPFKSKWQDGWDEETKLNEQIVSASTTYKDRGNGIFEIYDARNEKIKQFCQVLTTRKFPDYVNTAVTQNLFIENFEEKTEAPYIKTPYFTSVNIVIENKEKEKNFLQAKSKNNQWQAKLLGQGKRFFPKIEQIEKESEILDYLITNHNETIFRMQFSVCVSSDNLNTLEEQVSSIESNFSKKNWDLQVETDMAIPVFLYSLPFQFDLRYKEMARRFKTTLRSNNAAVTPLLNDMKGSWGKTPLMVQFGRTGQVQFFDNFGNDGNSNMVVAAGSRAGKTFWVLDYVFQSLSAGRMLRIIEAGRNFEAICQEFGGKFLRFQDNDDTCLNIFTDAKTVNNGSELHPDEITTIVPLVGLMIGRQLIASNDDDMDPDSKSDAAIISSYVEKAVRNAYKNHKRQTGMEHVKEELQSMFEQNEKEYQFKDERLRDIIIALSPYADKFGVFYKYFNGPRNVYFSDNALVVFELNDLKNKDESLMFVVLMALIKIVANEFYGEELEDVLKSLICDEAWMILDHPFIASFLIRIWRTIGKHKGAGISISQDVDLYFKNKDMEAIYNNSTYKVFLKQNKEQLDRLAAEKKISSDPFFLSKLKSLKSIAGYYSEMVVKIDNDFFLSRIIVDRFSFYLYSTPDKVPMFNEVRKEYGLQKNETAFVFEYVDMNEGATFAEAYEELLINKGIKERDKTKKEKIDDVEIEEEEEDELNSLDGIVSKIIKILKKLFNKS